MKPNKNFIFCSACGVRCSNLESAGAYGDGWFCSPDCVKKGARKHYRDDLLKLAFDRREETLRAFYEKTGIAINTQRKILNGEINQLDSLRRFADALCVDWLTLFDFNSPIAELEEMNNL